MLMTDNLSSTKGRAYHIEACSGYCAFNAVNQVIAVHVVTRNGDIFALMVSKMSHWDI